MYTYTISPSFSQGERQAIRRGFAQWEAATDGAVTFGESDRDGSIVVHPVEESDPRMGRLRKLTGAKSLVAGALDNQILIIPEKIEPGMWETVTAHEVGHTLGLRTHLSSGNVMSESYQTVSKSLTCQDVQSVCTFIPCDAQRLPICRR